MRSQNEVLEIMEMLHPYLNKIAKDMDKDVSIQFCLTPTGSGWVILQERNKDVEYNHVVDLVDCVATNWHVEHRFVDGLEDMLHQGVEDQYLSVVS